MPNVGKSTLYNALSNCSIPAENFPFCTIDPNSTRVNVPDERFDWLVDHHKIAESSAAGATKEEILLGQAGAAKALLRQQQRPHQRRCHRRTRAGGARGRPRRRKPRR